jgi:hypothetical protein
MYHCLEACWFLSVAHLDVPPVTEKQQLGSYLTKFCSPRLRNLLDPSNGHMSVLNAMMAPSLAKDAILDMVCGSNTVSDEAALESGNLPFDLRRS